MTKQEYINQMEDTHISESNFINLFHQMLADSDLKFEDKAELNLLFFSELEKRSK